MKTSRLQKLLFPAIIAACLTACSEEQVPELPAQVITVSETPYFHVKRCINMGNALEAPNEGDWGYTIKASHFKTIASAGFDTVRVPIRWDAHTSESHPYTIDDRFMQRIKDVVDQAQRAGLGVIIDVHHYEALNKWPRRETPRYMAIWAQIAETFKDAPDNVYFEILNEPVLPMTMTEANQIYRDVIPLIRKTNPVRPIILGGDDWNHVDRLERVRWPNDPYLVATFHDYGPFEFTHQGASWLDHPPATGRKWGKKSDLEELEQTYATAKSFHTKTKLPIFVGEFGVVEGVPDNERTHWMAQRRAAIEEAGFSWCAWDFGGAFKAYDLNRKRWFPGFLDALTGP